MESSSDKPKRPRPGTRVLKKAVTSKDHDALCGERRRLTDQELVRVRKLLAVAAERNREALKLYFPLPNQMAFHQSTAPERMIRGSNQAGKTLAAAVEVAWAATGQHPYLPYPKGGMEIYLVAKDGKQVGEVWWRKLCLPGPFEMIRDEKTREWRSYQPWETSDQDRKSERVPAGPLIPQRFWDGEPIWENKGAMVPRILKLKNGTRIHFFTGNAKPPHGTQIHMAAFDEEIGSQLWYSEIAARLLRFKGKFIWSATPQAATEGLYELHLRAEAEEKKAQPAVTEHFLHIKNNPHIDEESKQILLGKLTDPEQKRVRWDGEYAGSQLHIFPEWNINIHGHLHEDEHGGPIPIPADWTRYMVVDPGHAVCAVLFAAVPPKSVGDYIYLYDELYIQPCMNADMFAARVEAAIKDQHFYEFVIDSHGGRTTEQGSGLTIAQQYSRALARKRIASESTGADFIWGMDDVLSGNMAVHDWLHVRANTGDAKLRVLARRTAGGSLECLLPNFDFEIKRYRKKRAPDGTITDKPYDKHDHLMSCLRYLRGRNPQWHPPVKHRTLRRRDGLSLLNDLKKRFGDPDRGTSHVNLGPGASHSVGAY